MLFLSKPEILLLHSQLIQLTGGSDGLRDEGALEAAISAQQRAYYERANLVACAATYAYHLCQAHAFIDGTSESLRQRANSSSILTVTS